MDHNQITNIPKSMFSLATNLTKLNLRDNTLASLIGPDLHELKTLVELDFGSNHLTELPTEIDTLIALEVLRLNYNQLTVSCLYVVHIIHTFISYILFVLINWKYDPFA
ncbi:unnamed protein product [Trichobilharzia regenti]|nr:unnamed protein product [Trichobilharzia regenti]